MPHSPVRMRSALLLAATGASLLFASPALAKTTVVASALDNPRGLALAPDGTLYVASAGKGGTQGCFSDPEGGKTCFGTSGKILSFKDGKKTTVATGLLSAASPDGSFGTGADAVSVAPDGSVVTVITSGTPKDIAKAPKTLAKQAGAVIKVGPGVKTTLGRVSPYEWKHNVDKVKGDVNSNPYGVLALDGHTLVADAGANAIFDITEDGTVSVFAVIPKNGKEQAVPTSLALGPDGNVYIGELAFGAGPKKARIWSIPVGGGELKQYATGFTAISGLAFAPDGTLYVTELTLNIRKNLPGEVVKIAPDGKRTVISEKGLLFPAGAAADATGVYVSAFSTLPARTPKKSPFQGAGGQIVKITP